MSKRHISESAAHTSADGQSRLGLFLTEEDALQLYQLAYHNVQDGDGERVLQLISDVYPDAFGGYMPEPWEWDDE